jgi:hypothetical protein
MHARPSSSQALPRLKGLLSGYALNSCELHGIMDVALLSSRGFAQVCGYCTACEPLRTTYLYSCFTVHTSQNEEQNRMQTARLQ